MGTTSMDMNGRGWTEMVTPDKIVIILRIKKKIDYGENKTRI